jgi:hypothetical protein
MDKEPLLYREKYYYRPRNKNYNINIITINSKCNYIDRCNHDVKIDYTNNTITELTLDKIELYDLLNKCDIPDVIIEKHFRIDKKKKFLSWFCCC